MTVTTGNRGEPVDVKRLRKRARDFHHGDLRAAAIEMTHREVEKHGHHDISLERIAAKLGVTRPALYRHFADKTALLAEVAHLGWVRFEAALTEAFIRQDTTWAALRVLGTIYIEFCRDNPSWFRLQFSHPVPHPDFSRAPARYAPLMLDALKRELPPGEAEAAYRGLWGMAHGLSALVVEGVPIPFADSLRLYVRSLEAHAAQLRASA